jgi:hypothetical protein
MTDNEKQLAYYPLDTPLLKQIRKVRETTKQAWVIVDGLEILPEQATAQFELMTGRKAPKTRMRLTVRENYHRYTQEQADIQSKELEQHSQIRITEV